MPGLSEVYSPATVDRRRTAGAALLVAGLALAAVAAFVAGGAAGDPGPWVAGALAGVALPAALLGVLAVVGARDRALAAGAVGAGVAGLGVGLLVETRPAGWQADPAVLGVAGGVYALGVVTTLACTAVAVARRAGRPSRTAGTDGAAADDTVADDAPTEAARATGAGDGDAADGGWTGGWNAAAERVERWRSDRDADDVATASDGGRATTGVGDAGRVATDAVADGTMGSGATSDGRDAVTSGAEATSGERSAVAGAGATGGRATTAAGVDDDGVVLTDSADEEGAVPSDAYCGNCAAFRYVRSDGVMRPYCAHNDALMDDMTACEDWRANQ